ncbi:peptidylprolyl isomerase [Algibacter miyuki]|nr:peptidylprolyl isomerase [Algibacter miyuki]MDN3665516.1 peptidylprolyl isomerase [Algibacter miyuki]
MRLKIKNLKFINSLKFVSVALLFIGNGAFAQEIIEDAVEAKTDSTTVAENVATVTKASYNKQKVDAVAAVVGDFIVLESDVDKTYLQLEAQGVNIKDIESCQLFGKLLEDKLYAHHAIQDSIIVSDAEIRSMVDYQMEQFLAELKGDMNRLLALYEKDDEKSVREEMFEINKKNKLAKDMQAKIVEEVEVTPEEVRLYFTKIPKEERPTFGTELKVAQIVSEPKVSDEAEQKVIDRLKEFKADIIENGASFRSKAVLYSEDPGSASRGGKYTLNKKQPRMVKEFRQVAFALQEGEISEPFKSDFGYHIITVDKIRGQEYDVSHILLTPKVSQEAITEAQERLEKVRARIESGDITFAEAAREASDEKETRNDGGQLINPATQDYNFELTKMDPELYSQIQNLKDGEMSMVLSEQDRSGNIKFKLLRITDRIDEHEADYARDYLKIRDLALDEKKIKAIEDWQKEKIADTYIKIGTKYRDCEFSSNWLKN